MKALPPWLLLVQTFVLRFRKLKCEKSGWLVSYQVASEHIEELRPGLRSTGQACPRPRLASGGWASARSPPHLPSAPTPPQRVGLTQLCWSSLLLVFRSPFLTLCSLWRSPSSPACVIGLRDLLSQVVFAGLLPASLAKGRTVQLPWRPFVHIWLSSGDTQPVSSKNRSPAFLQPSPQSSYSPLIAVCSFLSLQTSSRSDGLWAPCWGKSLRPALASAVLLHSTVSSSWSWCVVVCFLFWLWQKVCFKCRRGCQCPESPFILFPSFLDSVRCLGFWPSTWKSKTCKTQGAFSVLWFSEV